MVLHLLVLSDRLILPSDAVLGLCLCQAHSSLEFHRLTALLQVLLIDDILRERGHALSDGNCASEKEDMNERQSTYDGRYTRIGGKEH